MQPLKGIDRHMRKQGHQLLFAATDLANHLVCTHLTELERAVAEERIKLEYYSDPTLELLAELGKAHEQAYLDYLRASGREVVEIREFGGQESAQQTLDAIRQGVDVIAQAVLESPPWQGRADFLTRVERPSHLGAWSYEVSDAKLSQTTRATAVMQLCLYSDILAEVQGKPPARMHIVKPGDPFDIDTLRVADFLAYYRLIRRRFVVQLANGPDHASYPQPNANCNVCGWRSCCDRRWRDDDHLSLVAGISKLQIVELNSHGIETLESFATAKKPLPTQPKRGSLEAFARSHRQARIQLAGRRSGRPEYEFNNDEPGRGFWRLPEPDPGDIFFDIEGNPRAVGEGLEYLLGFAVADGGGLVYQALWGLYPREEKQRFEQFIDFVMQRWKQHPGLHIYHFAPYEPSALKRLATRHATREDELDKLLRAERFVDLFAVVRQGIRASVESYSIKKLEPFYGYERQEMLDEARRALREVERLIELEMTDHIPPEHRQIVEKYNQDDCVSTAALRDWLERLRHELVSNGTPLQRPPLKSGDASETIRERADETQRVFDALIEDIVDEPQGEEQQARWLLAHMLDYFRREDKCAWWEYFRMHELEHEDLLYEQKAVTGLTFVGQVPGGPRDKLPTHRYRFEPQDATLEVGDDLVEVMGDKIGSLAAIDLEACTLDIKKRRDSIAIDPAAVFTFEYISPVPMPESLLEFGKQLLKNCPRSARYDLLCRQPPRLKTLSLPVDGDLQEAAIRLAFDLNHSTLAIQGPPGSGKTYIASHMIASLARAGKRVGVTAVSHKVISKLLEGVHEVSRADGAVAVAHQMSSPGDDFPKCIERLNSKDESSEALADGYVVGGTAWLWSNAAMEDSLDYLFIDEAGQMSLPMALAAGRAAKNMVLLGDPQQLEQPTHGTHPKGTDVSALTHVLDGAETMPDDKGLFLKNTWRLHPEICRFTSEQYYDGRLACEPGLESQEIVSASVFTGSGLRFIPVVHEGNQSRSDDEVAAIVEIVRILADGGHRWVNKSRVRSTITLEDILIIAPYNAQVSALKTALSTGARVGTVDKFQGQEAPVVIYSMTSSSAADAPRGMDFLFSRNRMNVATSRARCLVLLVGSPRLFEPACSTPHHMRLANGFCRYLEMARELSVGIIQPASSANSQ
jgi:uncharacterized protein